MYPLYNAYYLDQIRGNKINSVFKSNNSSSNTSTITTSIKNPSQAVNIVQFDNYFTKKCPKITFNSDIDGVVDIEAMNLLPYNIAVPCGSLPRYFPSDRFTLMESITSGTTYKIYRYGIYDNNDRYNFTIPNDNQSWLNITDYRFSVWMKERSRMHTTK